MADKKKEEYSRAAGAGPQSQAEAPHQSLKNTGQGEEQRQV